MKKLFILSVLLISCSSTSSVSLTNENTYLRFGSCVKINPTSNVVSITSSSLVLKDQKIKKSYIDTIEIPFKYEDSFLKIDTSKTQTINAANNIVESKKELKERYGMSSINKLEWYQQTSNYELFSINKSIEDLLSSTNTEIVETGCSISIDEFIDSIKNQTDEKMFNTNEDYYIGSSFVIDGFNNNVLDVTLSTSIFNSNYKLIEASINAYQIPLLYDGILKINPNTIQTNSNNSLTQVLSKRELKDNYGLSSINKIEWYIQVDNYINYCKTLPNISNLNTSSDVIITGCSIDTTSFEKSLIKNIKNKSILDF